MTTQALKAVAATAPARPLADMKPKEQIAYLLNQKKGELAKMIPKTLSIDRLLKVAQIAATTTPALARCDVPSLIGAIGQCAQMGLEPNTVLGHAYLVPFNTKRKDADGNERWVNAVQVIIGYKGLLDLARRSGQIVSIAAHEVCENDRFELVYGLDEKLNHTPAMGERGAVIGFYAIARLKDGGHCFEFMSRLQVEGIRDASQGWQQAVKYKKQDSHPWAVHFVEMGRKTVIRRLAKYLPLSIEFQSAVALDAMAASGQDQKLDTFDGEFMQVQDEDAAGAATDQSGGSSAAGGEESGGTGQADNAQSASSVQPPTDDRPTFEDAIAAVQRGEIDFAKEVAASLPDGQRQQVEAAIANKQAAGQQPSGGKRSARAGQQSFSVE